MRHLPAVILSFAVALPAAAQDIGYAGQQDRDIKALSAQETADLLAGRGMGMARAGELNHHPGPAHVLELRDKLALTPEQVAAAKASFERMAAAARPLGAELVGRERALDAAFKRGAFKKGAFKDEAFKDGALTPDGLARQTADIAAVQGRLRAVHLAAHLEMRRLLSPQQVAAYDGLRGYAGPAAEPGAHHGTHRL